MTGIRPGSWSACFEKEDLGSRIISEAGSSGGGGVQLGPAIVVSSFPFVRGHGSVGLTNGFVLVLCGIETSGRFPDNFMNKRPLRDRKSVSYGQ